MPTPVPKKTTWVELYFDLVFVLAVAQLAHVVADGSGWRTVGFGFGIFAALWWTWIGFALFYNRYGDEHSTWQRLVVLAGTVPCGLAAVAVNTLAHGERTAFTLSLAAVRVLLAVVHRIQPGRLPDRIAIGYLVSATGIALSVFLPNPWWWLLWIAMIVLESVVVFTSHARYRTLPPEEVERLGKDFTGAMDMMRPADPEYALQGPHLAERFGLFVIIVLGEVVASAGAGALGGEHVSWSALAGAIALAGALWWIYFESAVVYNERLLVVSGGSPELARSTFAFGHMFPAFGLLMTAAGLRQLLGGHPGQIGFWLVSVGLGIYLVGSRVDGGFGPGWLVRQGVYAVTFPLGLLGYVLSPQQYIWTMCGWMAVCGYVTTVGGRAARELMKQPATG